jgi:hypothetical protein
MLNPEATFTKELANIESPTYKFLKKLSDKQLFVTLKSFNFLLSCYEEDRDTFVELFTEQQIVSAVGHYDNYESGNNKRVKDLFLCTYPILINKDLGEYSIRTTHGLMHNTYSPNTLANMKALFSYVEVPTVYVTLKGLVTLNFDIDKYDSWNFFSNVESQFKGIDEDHYMSFLVVMISIRARMLMSMYLV